MVVEQEDDTVVYGGAMKAPKVLADIVESIAAAVYVDLGFDLQALWEVYSNFMICYFFKIVSFMFQIFIICFSRNL